MKKLLLSLAAVALTASASATDYTFTCGSAPTQGSAEDTKADIYTYNMTAEPSVSGFTFTANKNTGSNPPTWNKNANDVRIYAKGNFNIAVPEGQKVTSVVFKISTQGKKRLAPISASVGTIATQAKGDATVKWTGSVENSTITFTVGDNANYGSEGESKAGQLDFDNVVVTAEATSIGGKKPAGLAFSESTIKTGSKYATMPTLINPNNLEVTYSSSNEDVATVTSFGADFPPMLTINSYGTAVITATSAETDEFAAGTASFTLTYVESAKNIDGMFKMVEAGNNTVFVNFSMYVTAYERAKTNNGYQSYIYVTDAAGTTGTLLYSPADLGENAYKAGDILPAGWDATYTLYNGLVEWKGTFPNASDNDPYSVSYQAVENVTAADINKVVTLTGVVVAEATPDGTVGNYTATLADGSELLFRNTFALATVEPGTYDVIGAVSVYGTKTSAAGEGTLQFLPIEFNKHIAYPTDLPENIKVTASGNSVVNSTYGYNAGYGCNVLDIVINSADKNVDFNIETPQGYDCLYFYWMKNYDDTDIEPIKIRKAPSEWIDPSVWGATAGNTFTVPTEKKSLATDHEGYMWFGFNGKMDEGNKVSLSLKAIYDESVGVENIETEGAEAEYYTLQGVKVANPENGVYVKVANGKAEKVVIK